MIPRRLFFNWLGPDVPAYARFAMDAFARVNPDFEIRFLHEPDPGHPRDPLLAETLRLVAANDGNPLSLIFNRPWARKNLDSPVGRLANLSDCLRLLQVERLGGIYLDLDTFPVRPFDDRLLSCGCFFTRFCGNRCDTFFFGAGRGDLFTHIEPREGDRAAMAYRSDLPVTYHNALVRVARRRFLALREKFLLGSLRYGESVFMKESSPWYYIDHYKRNHWQKVARKVGRS